MPTPSLDEPTKKITLNIYLSDYKAMIGIHGAGWSTRIRELIREHVKKFGKGPSNA